MFQKSIITITLFISSFLFSYAQETLPQFTLLNKGNKRIAISWTNGYGNDIRQLSIQRSFDSLRNFSTILTLPDPTVIQNGFIDSKAFTDHMYYRLYILLDSGKYIFSKSKRPLADSVKVVPVAKETNNSETNTTTNSPATSGNDNKSKEAITDTKNKEAVKIKEIPERIIYIKKRDSLIAQVGEKSLKKYKDSLVYRTKDTILYNTPDTILIKPFVPKEVYKPSKFVFTEKDGNVRILLPDANIKKYSLKFFEEDNSPAFEIKHVRETNLLIDKSNFLHAGWFKFELYEEGQLKEKHKLFIPKEF